MSSSESLEPGSTHSVSSGFQPTVHRQPWKGSTQSLRSHGSRQPCKFYFCSSGNKGFIGSLDMICS